MAYGLKYYTEFADKYDHAWLIEFYFKDYSGSSTEVLTAANPLTYNYGGDDRDITRPIFGKEAIITLMSVVDFQFIDFHAANSRSIRCDIKKDGVLDFSGWVLPDLFTEPYIAPPYPVSISCRCGLGELAELEIPTEINQLVRDEGGEVGLTTFPDLYSIIAGGLLTIETDLKLNEAINVYSNTDDLITNSPIADTNINLSAYEGKSYYDAISDILKTFGSRLYQMEGEWWIVRIKELQSTMSVRKWTMSAGDINVFTTTDTKITTFKVGKPEGSNITQGAMLDILPAWKKTTAIQTLSKNEDFIINGDFSQYYERATSNPALNAYGITEVYPPLFWNMTPIFEGIDATTRTYRDSNGEFYLYLINIESISQTITDIKAGAYLVNPYIVPFEEKLRLNIEIACVSTNAKAKLDIRINGDETYYLMYDESDQENLYKFTLTPSFIELENFAAYNSPVNIGEFSAISIVTENIPIDGDLVITLINNMDAGENLALKKISLEIIEDKLSPIDFDETNIIARSINKNNIYIPSDIETVGGDLPNIPNNTKIWRNGYRLSSGVATRFWHERGSEIETQLLRLTQQDYKEFFYQPQFKLSLPILSEHINFDSCIVDYQILPKKYICNSATIDVRNSVFSGTFMEFGAWEEGNWVLKDGVWTDENLWLEEGEVWED